MLWFVLACNVDAPLSEADSAEEPADVPFRPSAGCVSGWRYSDTDRDGFGDPDAPVLVCPDADGVVDNGDDCDDGDPLVSPDGFEECDGVDNDCDGEVDGIDSYGAVEGYPDEDGDGFGPDDAGEVVCGLPDSWVAIGGDCDDSDGSVHPGVDETIDGIDQDCDGVADDGLTYGDGADGDVSFSGSDDLGDHGFACVGVSGLDAAGVEVEDSSAFAHGDRALLVVHQGSTESYAHAGLTEWVDVLSVSDGSVRFVEDIDTLAGVQLDDERVALYRVPSFQRVVVDGTLVAPSWDAGCGGLLVLLASESIDVAGTIDMAGAGFGGGGPNLEPDSSGEAGESWSGGGTKSNLANGGGGGGGGIDAHSCPDCESSGGGGGYGGDGGDGERGDPTKGDGGQGGVEYGTSSLERLHLGSGGGAGAADSKAEGGVGGAGGDGGGAIWLRAPVVSVGGALDARGGDGQGGCAAEDDWCLSGEDSEAGSGGGGSGGSVRVQGDSLDVSTPLVAGGSGAEANDGTAGWAGDGADGRSRVQTLE